MRALDRSTAIDAQATRRTQRAALAPLPLGVAALAVVLVLYNNAVYLSTDVAFPDPWLLYPRALLIPLAAVGVAVAVFGLTLREAGLAPRRPLAGAGLGFGLAACSALPVVAVIAGANVFGDALDFRNIESKEDELGVALYWAFVLYPLRTVVFEEVLFRGVLQGMARKTFGVPRAVLLTALTFALWHLVVNHKVLGKAELSAETELFFAFQAVAFAGLFLAGVALGLLRERSGGVLAPIATHWGFLVLLAGTIYVL